MTLYDLLNSAFRLKSSMRTIAHVKLLLWSATTGKFFGVFDAGGPMASGTFALQLCCAATSRRPHRVLMMMN
jgi:hypothetical protein